MQQKTFAKVQPTTYYRKGSRWDDISPLEEYDNVPL